MQRPTEYARLLEEGTTLRQQWRLDEAVRVLQTASRMVLNDPAVWSELAHAMRWQGQYGPAEEAARKALGLQPDHPSALFNLGAILVDTGRVNDGIASYRKALQLNPEFAEAWSNLGMTLGMIGKQEEEIEAYRRALEVSPSLAMIWSNLGSALAGLGQFDEAVASCRRSVSIDTEYAVGWSNLSDLLRQIGDFNEAIKASKRALQIEPELASAWHNLGTISVEIGNRVEAEASFRRAVELDSSLIAAWTGLGCVLERRNALPEAIAAHKRAVTLDECNAGSLANLVNAYWRSKQPESAIVALKSAIQKFPDHEGLRADLVYSMLEICDWDRIDTHLQWLMRQDDLCHPGREVSPFGSIVWCDDEALNLRVAQSAALKIDRRYAVHRGVSGKRNRSQGKLVIGYLSSDMRNHAVGHLMRGVFFRHDHSRFCINTYSVGASDGSCYRNDIEAASDVFRDICDLDYLAAAEQIAADGVDILVDLNGWTGGARFEICALRPASVQITYLGFPSTTGAPFFDYTIVDETIVPQKSACHYGEKLIYLPHCYQANDDCQKIADTMVNRIDLELPEKGVVFCCFNRPEKIDSMMFGSWMAILKRVPDAVLWLLIGNPLARRNLIDSAVAHGIAAERLIFAQPMPKPEHLRRIQLADIALDTRIYNGHTTTSDALWVGLPVVTMTGKQFASRVSESCLKAIGVPELVTHTLAEYEELAVRLALNSGELEALRARLIANRVTHPLFDTRRFTRNLERGYLGAWERYLGNEPPQSFKVLEA